MKYGSALLSLVFVWLAACSVMDPMAYIQDPASGAAFEKPVFERRNIKTVKTSYRMAPLERFQSIKPHQPVKTTRIASVPTRSASKAKTPSFQPHSSAPGVCKAPEMKTGQPLMILPGARVQPPLLLSRRDVSKPPKSKDGKSYYCAAFLYQVDGKGRLINIEPLHSSHPEYSAKAYAALKKWEYRPGNINGTPEKFIGYSAVFYHQF